MTEHKALAISLHHQLNFRGIMVMIIPFLIEFYLIHSLESYLPFLYTKVVEWRVDEAPFFVFLRSVYRCRQYCPAMTLFIKLGLRSIIYQMVSFFQGISRLMSILRILKELAYRMNQHKPVVHYF